MAFYAADKEAGDERDIRPAFCRGEVQGRFRATEDGMINQTGVLPKERRNVSADANVGTLA